jgi:capsule polysaccharide export protein KpsE/RkpR
MTENSRLRLIRRIHYMKEYIRSKSMLNFLEQTERVLKMDEDEITDLWSQIDLLERGLNGILPYFPDTDDSDKFIPPNL